MKEESKRIYWIDAAKIITMFMIVLGHTIAYSNQLQGLNKYINSFHVVMFFVISGLTFHINKYHNYKEFFIKKFKSIMVPYFVFAVLFLIPLYMFGNSTAQDLERADIDIGITKSIIGILYGNANNGYLKQNSALWFLPCLFVVENIYYFIEKLKTKKKYLIAMVGSLIIGALDYYFLPVRLPWGIDIALVMIFFFTIGRLLEKNVNLYKIQTLKSKKVQILIALFNILIGYVLQNLNDKVMYIHNEYGNYALFIISAFFSTIGYVYFIKNIPYSKFLQYAGQRTMAILIFHKLIVVLFQTKIKPIADLLNKNPFFLIELPIALAIVLVSIVLCLIADKIISKFCPEFLGKIRKGGRRI